MTAPENPESEEALEARLRRLLGDDLEDNDSVANLKARSLLEQPLPDVERHHENLDHVEAEFKDRIQGLDSRLTEAQMKRQQKEAADKAASATSDAQGLGTGLSIAYALLGIPILFGVIGVAVDKAFHTTLAGAITVTGIVLALAYVFYASSKQR